MPSIALTQSVKDCDLPTLACLVGFGHEPMHIMAKQQPHICCSLQIKKWSKQCPKKETRFEGSKLTVFGRHGCEICGCKNN